MPIKDKEKRKAYIAQWQRDNPEKNLASGYRYWAKHPQKKLLKSSKANAKTRQLEHSIVEEDIIIPEYCPYLNIKLTYTVESCNHPTTISIDRIDSSKGYTKDNIQVISRLANLMKSYATQEQLITFAENVLKLHKGDI